MGEHESPTQRASRELAEAVFADPELRAKFEAMAKRTLSTDPVPDDLSWVAEYRDSLMDPRDERVSLAPLTPEQALRGLLATPPEKKRH